MLGEKLRLTARTTNMVVAKAPTAAAMAVEDISLLLLWLLMMVSQYAVLYQLPMLGCTVLVVDSGSSYAMVSLAFILEEILD